MNEYAKIFIKCKVDLVVCIIDDYTSKPISSRNINVYLEGIRQKPINKRGHYVFINLEDSRYTLKIDSEHYFNEAVEVDTESLTGSNQVLYIRLKPRPSYPFDTGAGLLRFKVLDSDGVPAKGAQVRAIVVSKENYIAKTIHQNVRIGDNEISLICVGGSLTQGEALYISDENSSEECMIEAYISYEDGIVKLIQPLKYEHLQGTLLMPEVITSTDDRGEAVIYFKNFSTKLFEILTIIEHKGKSIMKNHTVEEGKSLYLGHIRL